MIGGVTNPGVLVDEWQIAAAGGLGHVALILLAAAVIATLPKPKRKGPEHPFAEAQW